MSNLLILGLVAAPASFVTGFSAAAMSFTAWNIIVPLMFAAFNLPVFQALFISVMLDVCNGATLIIIYGLNGKVDFKYGLTFGAYAAIIGVSVALAASNFISNNEDKLKQASSFVPLLIAIQFLIRGVLAVRNKRRTEKLQREQAEALGIAVGSAETEEDDELAQGYVAVDKDHLPSVATSTSAYSLNTNEREVEEQVTVPRTRSPKPPKETTPLIPETPTAINGQAEDGDDSEQFMDDEGLNVNKVSSWRFWLYLYMERFTSDEDILHHPLKYTGARIALTLAVFFILGGVAGLLYAGGGMFYANIIVNAWGAKIRTAAGTGCFIMTMVMLMIAFTFIGRDGMNSIDNLYHILMTVPFGIIGAIVGARLALRISDMIMYFVIFGVSIALFVYIVIQNKVLSSPEPEPTPTGGLIF